MTAAATSGAGSLPRRLRFLEGGGTATRLILDRDWTVHPLGRPEDWPLGLKTSISLILNSPESMILAWGCEDLYFFFNDSYAPLLGPRAEWAMGAPFAQVWADAWDQAKPIIDAAFAGNSARYENLPWTLGTDRGAAETWWSFSYSRVLDAEGVVAGLFILATETTETVLTERARVQSVEQLERAQEAGAVGLFTVGVDGMVHGTAQFFRLYGLPAGEGAASNVFEALIVPEDRHLVSTMASRSRGEVSPDVIYRVRRADTGEIRWIARKGDLEKDADGGFVRFIGVARDVTDQVGTERQLATEREQLRQMFEQAPIFMALLEGREHRVARANPGFVRLIGGRDVIGKTVAEGLPDAVEQGLLAQLDQVYASGNAFSAEAMLYSVRTTPSDKGVDRFVDFVCQPLRDASGQIVGIFVEGADVTERVIAEQAARVGEIQFHSFAQLVPNHVWMAAPDGQLDWFNDQLLAYSGEPTERLIGSGWTALVHSEDVAEAAQHWAASLASGEAYETEFRIRRFDGDYRWHLVRALPIRDDRGRVLRWVGTNTDIHEQRLSHVESLQDRNRLWVLSQDLLLICGLDGTITAVNPSATRMLGWSEEEMIGLNIADFLHPDDLATTEAEVAELSHGVATLAFENRYRTRRGDYRLLSWTAVPEAGRIHAIGRDVTEERKLSRDRERIWNVSPVLKVVTDEQGVITDVNPAWAQTVGWHRDEVIGRRSTDFMIDDEAFFEERIAALRSGRQLLEYRTKLLTRSGERRIVQWSTVPEGGAFYGFGRDVTAEVEAAEALQATEAALRQSQKMEAVGQLTGGIAHDFNNLLQGITGSLEIVQRRVAQGRTGDLDRFVVGASNAAHRAAALTHRLLAFSRRQPLDPKPVRANALVASMEDLLRRTIGERIVLELMLAGGLWTTRCDPNQLESAILNLVINARDAMPDGGALTIETCNAHLDGTYAAGQRGVTPGQYVCICVTDTGTGMDADTIAKAFEPFFTTKPIGQGTGLGLSMIYGFAQQSEGYAKIYSEVGRGTTFKLYLPRFRGSAEEHEIIPERTEAHFADEGEVVLVVEDEPVVRALIVEELQELGYAAIEAEDGPKGLEVLQSGQRIDLLITDIGLPGLNGRQVADAARLLRPTLRILFMTGYAENAALAAGFLEPGMEMITKPFAMEAMATRIRTMLGDRGR